MTDSPFPLEPTAAEAQTAIAEEFGFFGDWSERYQYLRVYPGAGTVAQMGDTDKYRLRRNQ